MAAFCLVYYEHCEAIRSKPKGLDAPEVFGKNIAKQSVQKLKGLDAEGL